jgi:dihydroorotate dehydrogenase (NAD+) catalytic subunit
MSLDISVRISSSLRFVNPVGVASGTFGYGQEYAPLVDLNKIGTLYTKAVTLEPRKGNPPPRLVETPKGLINSIGLANPGVSAFIRDKLPFLRSLSCSVIVNIAGSTEDEYARVLESIEEASGGPGIAGYEINVSCPNVRHGGMSFGTDPIIIERLTRNLRSRTKSTLIVKLSPNVTSIEDMAKAAESGGADAVSCINTLVGMIINTETMRPAIGLGTGGLSGPAILPVGVACTWKVARAVKVPVIGIGGIRNAEDALQYLLAGASAVQIGTALFADPSAPVKALEGIVSWMDRHGVETVEGIRALFRM